MDFAVLGNNVAGEWHREGYSANSDDGEDIGFLATKSILKSQQRVTAIFAGEDAGKRVFRSTVQWKKIEFQRHTMPNDEDAP